MPGTKAKQAKALAFNIKWAGETFGIECLGFLTLTVGDVVNGRWVGVHERSEASRRFNSILNRIRERYRCGVIVTERHKTGVIHFHLLVVLADDIRTGLDFAAVARRDYRSASEALRGEWAWWRENQGKYGFGRHELMPVRTTGEQIGRYVAKYLGKSWEERTADDKGGRCVRYFGRWDKSGAKMSPPMSSRHGAVTPRACAWRQCMKQIQWATAYHGLELNENNIAKINGPRWAWRVTKQIQLHRFFVRAAGSAAEREGMVGHNEECETAAHVGESNLDSWIPGPREEADDCRIQRGRRANRLLKQRHAALEHSWASSIIWAEAYGEDELRKQSMASADAESVERTADAGAGRDVERQRQGSGREDTKARYGVDDSDVGLSAVVVFDQVEGASGDGNRGEVSCGAAGGWQAKDG